jgi:hypothetical protein
MMVYVSDHFIKVVRRYYPYNSISIQAIYSRKISNFTA